MATTIPRFPAVSADTSRYRAWLGWREHLVTLVLGFWLMAGLFLDGWAHNNLSELETFFTPWHAVFYSGFLANAIWLAVIVIRQMRSGRVGIAAIPQGYHLGVIGVFVFGLGGIGDMIWHIIFGIEQDIAILLSPTHLLLFLGGSLIFASPFLAGWIDPTYPKAPSFGRFLPTLGSLALVATFASFMHMYAWNFLRDSFDFQRGRVDGLESILITNAILIAPVLLMLRRWRVPFGSITFFFTLNTALMDALQEFRAVEMIAMAFVAGLLADLMILWLKPTPARPAAYRIVAAAIPLILWSLRFWTAILIGSPIRWQLELTAGITVMCALAGFALSLLIAPPAIPDEQ